MGTGLRQIISMQLSYPYLPNLKRIRVRIYYRFVSLAHPAEEKGEANFTQALWTKLLSNTPVSLGISLLSLV